MVNPGPESVGIGSVIETLREDFPDVSISKVRYLEAEGLLTPGRTPAGFRRYSAEDIGRLRYILLAQQERFWPLKVIRERLDALERGFVAGDDGVPVVPESPSRPLGSPEQAGDLEPQRRPLRLNRAELAAEAGIDLEVLDELGSYRLIDLDQPHHDDADLRIATAAGRLVAAGVEVRHLRTFLSSAEREAGLVEHVVGRPGLRSGAARSGGVDDAAVATEVASQCLDLHAALMRRELARLGIH